MAEKTEKRNDRRGRREEAHWNRQTMQEKHGRHGLSWKPLTGHIHFGAFNTRSPALTGLFSAAVCLGCSDGFNIQFWQHPRAHLGGVRACGARSCFGLACRCEQRPAAGNGPCGGRGGAGVVWGKPWAGGQGEDRAVSRSSALAFA